jgi:RNA-directed DNA polymerase
MNGPEKSDSPIVAVKPANEAARAAEEQVEPRGGIKENANQQTTVRTQSREAVSHAQDRIREAVTRNRAQPLTTLLHHVSVDVLRAGFFSLKKTAAPGVDGLTWTQYEEGLEVSLQNLHARVHGGGYRALASRRRYIPKADGRRRPLGIAALEDKIVQAAVAAILTPIYEAEFLGFSYGFRPERGQHDALDALAYGLGKRRINFILDADIRSFFDTISHAWLIRFIEHRIGDRRIVRLIRKWLAAGVLEEGRRIETVEGTPQGAVISPLLANVYLHYVYDLWVRQWRQRQSTGDMIVVRYADDTIVGFEHQHDAERFLEDLSARMADFGLGLHPEKTRLIEFGRKAIATRRARCLGKPETFDFLGFTHYCATRRSGGGFVLGRTPVRERMRAKLRQIKERLKATRHDGVEAQGKWLAQVLRGWLAYYAVPMSAPAITAFRHHLVDRWLHAIRRRGQKHRLAWPRMKIIANRYLPYPRIQHPWPEQRFLVNHPR